MVGWDEPAHRLDGDRLAGLFAQVDWQLEDKRPGAEPIEVAVLRGRSHVLPGDMARHGRC